MPDANQETERTVRVTIRISVPFVSIEDVVVLEKLVSGLVHDLEGSTYDLTIASPRPER